MTAIIIPRRHYTQPQGAVELDRSNPLAENLVAFLLFNNGLGWDVAENAYAPVATGNPILVPTQRGVARSFNELAAGQYISNNAWASRLGRYNGAFAIGWIPRGPNRGSYVASMRYGTSSRFYLRRAESGGVQRAIYGFGTELDAGIGPAWPEGEYGVSSLEWGATSHAWYFNGAKYGVGSAAASWPTTAAIASLSNLPSTETYHTNGIAEWFGVWAQPLGPELNAELARNPYQIVRASPARIYSLPSGAISLSINSITASSITQTGARITLGVTR